MEPYSDKFDRGGACEDWAELLVLYAAGELDEAETSRVREHLANCTACETDWEAQTRLLGALAERHTEPDAVLLASCRSGLVDALDQQEDRGWWRRTIGWILPTNWLDPHPAWSAALLVMLGFGVGVFGPRIVASHTAANPPATTAAASSSLPAAANPENNAAAAQLTAARTRDFDLHSADVAGIRVMPAGDDGLPQVELQMRSQEPLQGTVDNDNIKHVLLHILANGQSSDPDARLDAVDLLRTKNNDPDVRSALCHAVHTDPNAAVRLKALEALNGAEPQDLVRQTLLDALVDDQNPGVRVEAINALRDMAAKGQVSSDDHMLAVLRERMRKDPNTYIRLQSAAAIRDLGPSEKF